MSAISSPDAPVARSPVDRGGADGGRADRGRADRGRADRGPVDHSVLPPAHGFSDDEETRRLLRSRPPPRALDWVARQIGGRVVSTKALLGGLSSAVHLVVVQLPGGMRHPAVLRRYVRPELNEEEPDIAAREADALRYLGTIDVPTPALVAVDNTGEEAGVPAVLMSQVPGRVDWWPTDMERWLRRMAEMLPLINGAALPAAGVLRTYACYEQSSYEPPSWARWPSMWRRAVDISRGAAPGPAVVLQRDFHPGNVLWRRGVVTGIVDWQMASIGPPSADVAHCRANLLRFGLATADRFTRIWEESAGDTFDPWGDVVTIVGFLDGLRDEPGSDNFLVEDVLAAAVAGLT